MHQWTDCQLGSASLLPRHASKIKEVFDRWRLLVKDHKVKQGHLDEGLIKSRLQPNSQCRKVQLVKHTDTSSNESSSTNSSTWKETKPRRWTQVMSLLPVYLLQISYGMNTGYPAIVTPQLEEPCSEFRITADEESWIVSLDNFATPVVCILSGFLQQYFGPLKVLVFACFPYALGWVVAAMAVSAEYLYLSRILVGISNALLATTVYTVEVASKEMRGTYSLLEAVLRCFGCLLIYCLGYVMRWQTVATFGWVVPAAALATCLTCASESPVFLIATDKIERARNTLYKLYGPEYRVDEEVEIIRANLKERNCGKSRHTLGGYMRKLTRSPEVYKPFTIVLFLCVIQQFSGMSVLRAYVVKIFDEIFNGGKTEHTFPNSSQFNSSSTSMFTAANGTDNCQSDKVTSKAYLSAIVMGFCRMAASLLLSKLLRIYRRRAMYFFSATATTVSILCFATCNFVVSHYATSETVQTALNWASLATACALVFSVQLGVQTLPFLLSGELFPSDVRAFCKGLTRSAACLLIVANLKVYPVLERWVGIGGAFYLFAGVLVAAVPVVYFVLPETKDLGLEMIQEYFKPQRTVFYVQGSQEGGSSLQGCEECPHCLAVASIMDEETSSGSSSYIRDTKPNQQIDLPS